MLQIKQQLPVKKMYRDSSLEKMQSKFYAHFILCTIFMNFQLEISDMQNTSLKTENIEKV